MTELTKDLFLRLEHRSIPAIIVRKCYVDLTGDFNAGMLLGQIIWHFLPFDDGNEKPSVVHRDGATWIAKRREDWWAEIRLSPKEYDRAIARLKDLELVKAALWHFEGYPTTHIRINWPVFLPAFTAYVNLPFGQNPNPQEGKNDFDQKGTPTFNREIGLDSVNKAGGIKSSSLQAWVALCQAAGGAKHPSGIAPSEALEVLVNEYGEQAVADAIAEACRAQRERKKVIAKPFGYIEGIIRRRAAGLAPSPGGTLPDLEAAARTYTPPPPPKKEEE